MIDISKFVSRRPRVCEPSTRTKQQAKSIQISNAKDILVNRVLNQIADAYKENPETDIMAVEVAVDDGFIERLGVSLAQFEEITTKPIQGISIVHMGYEDADIDGVYSSHLTSVIISPSRAGWKAIASELGETPAWANEKERKLYRLVYHYGGILK